MSCILFALIDKLWINKTKIKIKRIFKKKEKKEKDKCHGGPSLLLLMNKKFPYDGCHIIEIAEHWNKIVIESHYSRMQKNSNKKNLITKKPMNQDR